MNNKIIYNQILQDIENKTENKTINLELGFNLCLLLGKLRDAYYFDYYYRRSFTRMKSIIKYIRKFKLFQIRWIQCMIILNSNLGWLFESCVRDRR